MRLVARHKTVRALKARHTATLLHLAAAQPLPQRLHARTAQHRRCCTGKHLRVVYAPLKPPEPRHGYGHHHAGQACAPLWGRAEVHAADLLSQQRSQQHTHGLPLLVLDQDDPVPQRAIMRSQADDLVWPVPGRAHVTRATTALTPRAWLVWLKAAQQRLGRWQANAQEVALHTGERFQGRLRDGWAALHHAAIMPMKNRSAVKRCGSSCEPTEMRLRWPSCGAPSAGCRRCGSSPPQPACPRGRGSQTAPRGRLPCGL